MEMLQREEERGGGITGDKQNSAPLGLLSESGPLHQVADLQALGAAQD